MRLVKIGNRYINMDNVCDISASTETVQLYLNTSRGYTDGGEGKIEQESIQVFGADAIALRHWLDANSEDVRAPMVVEE